MTDRLLLKVGQLWRPQGNNVGSPQKILAMFITKLDDPFLEIGFGVNAQLPGFYRSERDFKAWITKYNCVLEESK